MRNTLGAHEDPEHRAGGTVKEHPDTADEVDSEVASAPDSGLPNGNTEEGRTRGELLLDHIEEFRSNLRALTSFVDQLEPVLDAQYEATYEEHVRKAAAYSMFMTAASRGLLDEPIEIDTHGWSVSVVKTGEDQQGSSVRVEGDPEHVDEFMQVVTEFARSSAKRREAAKHMLYVPRQKALLYETCLISLVSIVEWFYSQLMSDLYRWYPDRLNTKDACFSLRDLEGFESIADAVEQMIEDRVSRHVHESIDAWIDDLVKWFSIPPETPIVARRSMVVEVVRRRDVFVHNGGCVSRLYLARVGKEDSALIVGLKKGDQLKVDHEYLDRAIELMETAFCSLALAIWRRADADDPGFRASYLLDLSFDALCEGRFSLAQYVGGYVRSDATAPDWERTAAKVNEWIAMKEVAGLDCIDQAVQQFDVSALSDEFKIAKLALLNSFDTLVEQLPDQLDRRVIRPEHLREWPLFGPLRDSDRWDDVDQMLVPREEGERQPALERDVDASPPGGA